MLSRGNTWKPFKCDRGPFFKVANLNGNLTQFRPSEIYYLRDPTAWNGSLDMWQPEMFLWPCSLAVPVLAGWVCVYGGSMSRNSRRLNRQWFWFLKRLRRRGNGLKSHPTDWEKPGIEPATPGLQDIGLSPTPRRLLTRNVKDLSQVCLII